VGSAHRPPDGVLHTLPRGLQGPLEPLADNFGRYKLQGVCDDAGAGVFLMQYVDCFYPSLRDFQRAALTLLAQDRYVEVLPEDAFVFFKGYNQEFAFFRTTEGNDPPVYAHKREWRRDPFRKVYHRFSDFLALEIEVHADCLADRKSVSYSSEQRRAIYEATMDKILATLARKQREEV
jgi:hypothetical protein